jgi:DNA-binding transcriptional LysR family regulator
MDHFKQIATFVNVVTHGSLSAAARHEGIAPAMVSRRLDALETRLGVKLLQRTTRQTALTPEGTAFAEDCQRILRELADAEGAASAGGAQASGRLRVTAPAGFGREFIAPLVARFALAHPQITVSLELTDRVVDLVAEAFDCAVRFGELADSSLVRVKLGASRRVVVASPDYVKRHGAPRHPDELAQHSCLALVDANAPGGQRGWTLRSGGEIVTYRVNAALACNDGAALHAWALAGCGLSWRSMWEVRDDLPAGRLVTVLDEFAAPPVSVYAVYPARRHLPRRQRLFTDAVQAAFSEPAMLNALGGTATHAKPRSRRAA